MNNCKNVYYNIELIYIMSTDIRYSLFSYLSEETLYQHIYPYIYNFQPKDLLCEIKQYSQYKSDLYQVYDIPVDRNVLYYDLLNYVNRRPVSCMQQNEGRENILRRHVMLKDYSAPKLLEFYTQCFSVNKMKNVETKCGVLWGLLTETERIRFIEGRLSFLERHL